MDDSPCNAPVVLHPSALPLPCCPALPPLYKERKSLHALCPNSIVGFLFAFQSLVFKLHFIRLRVVFVIEPAWCCYIGLVIDVLKW